MQLILDGQIKARIDSHNKVLYAKDSDQRGCTFEKALLVGRDYQRRTKMLILRTAMLKNHIHVKVCRPSFNSSSASRKHSRSRRNSLKCSLY